MSKWPVLTPEMANNVLIATLKAERDAARAERDALLKSMENADQAAALIKGAYDNLALALQSLDVAPAAK